MTAPKTIHEQPESSSRSPHKRFEDLASRVVNVPKKEIDKRDAEWHEKRPPKRET
jgi:hypothetical protein